MTFLHIPSQPYAKKILFKDLREIWAGIYTSRARVVAEPFLPVELVAKKLH
jgi:hypothetical protein